jgi:hypothetical protein
MPDSISLFTVFVSGSVSAFTGYVASRVSQRLQQRRNAYTYRLAVISEIRTLRDRLSQYELFFLNKVATGELPIIKALNVFLQPGAMAVFANNASSVGLFDTRTALRVLRFYAAVRALQGHASVLSDLDGRLDQPQLDLELHRHQAMLRGARRQSQRLVRRLRPRPMLEELGGYAASMLRSFRRNPKARIAMPSRS